ncbi:hypothetical protein [Neobacillus vireti]|uniref:hypothetical protein n=1 Tax=Neobacillus vireti TaxID=220686 RepID=UPI002FFFDB32
MCLGGLEVCLGRCFSFAAVKHLKGPGGIKSKAYSIILVTIMGIISLSLKVDKELHGGDYYDSHTSAATR